MTNNLKTAISTRTLQILLLESFRYCLGRMTGAVSDCVERLIIYWDIIPIQWQQQIQEDIKKAIDKNQAGMKMDIDDWQKILELEVQNDR